MIARANDNCFERIEAAEETQECERIVPQPVASRTAEPATYIWGMMPDENQPFFVQDESAEQFMFGGGNFDPDIPLMYFETRHFDPTSGQFMSTDPIEHDTANHYRYVAPNPTNHTDPTGL